MTIKSSIINPSLKFQEVKLKQTLFEEKELNLYYLMYKSTYDNLLDLLRTYNHKYNPTFNISGDVLDLESFLFCWYYRFCSLAINLKNKFPCLDLFEIKCTSYNCIDNERSFLYGILNVMSQVLDYQQFYLLLIEDPKNENFIFKQFTLKNKEKLKEFLKKSFIRSHNKKIYFFNENKWNIMINTLNPLIKYGLNFTIEKEQNINSVFTLDFNLFLHCGYKLEVVLEKISNFLIEKNFL